MKNVKKLNKKAEEYRKKKSVPLKKVLKDAGLKEETREEPMFPDAYEWHNKMGITSKCPKCGHQGLISVTCGTELNETVGYVCDWCGYEDID